MANKRDFKKNLSEVTELLLGELNIAAYEAETEEKAEILNGAMADVLKAYSLALIKSNVKFDKAPKAFASEHEYHKSRRAFFNEMYNKIYREYCDEIGQALSTLNKLK